MFSKNGFSGSNLRSCSRSCAIFVLFVGSQTKAALHTFLESHPAPMFPALASFRLVQSYSIRIDPIYAPGKPGRRCRMSERAKKLGEPNLDFLDSARDPREVLKQVLAFEAWGLVVFGMVIVYVLGLSGHGGPVGEIMVRIVTPLVGAVGVWILAFTLGSATIHLFAAGKWPMAGRISKFSVLGLPLMLGAWECGMHLRLFYWDRVALRDAGYIGLWFGRGLRLLVGEMGLLVAFVLLTILAFIVIRISPLAIVSSILHGVSSLFSRLKASRPQVEHITPELPVPEMTADIEEDEALPEAHEPDHEVDVPPGKQLELGLDQAPSLPRQRNYKLPPLDLLHSPAPPIMDDDYREFASQRIVTTLKTFGIPCHVSEVVTGPAVTRVEVVLGEGIRVNKVEGMEKDIAYMLPAKRVRVEAPIPGKTAIGIEFPNIRTNLVRMSELFATPAWKKARAPLTMALAKDLNNKPVLANLGRMPHLLVAGQTGSGKSVCLHAIMISLLYRLTPDQLRLILIDPKMVEFGFYEGLPHLLTPVVNDVTDAVNALRWSVQEMRDRYHKLKSEKARDILAFNRQVPAARRMPFIVIVIDEMADLMAQEGYEIEACITSLTQLARAVGIHLVLSTQRPSVKIITGNIKGNIPARIALNVASYNDSRTILDYKGAETLLGNGDMLYKPVDEDTPIRAQGPLVEDEEIQRVVEFLTVQGEPEFDDDVTAVHAPARPSRVSVDSDVLSTDDEVVVKALKIFLNEGEASTSMLQSKLKLGYPRARRMMMQMEEMGFVGPKNGSKPREINYSACRQALEASIDKELLPGPEMIPENDVDEILTSAQ